jgi:hypothetical protein
MHFKPSDRAVSIALLLLVLLSACTSTSRGTSSSASQGQTIVDLVEQKAVAVSITGVSMEAVALHITSISSKPQEILVPAGTYFVAENPSVQNMVARHAASATVNPGEIVDLKVDAACASLHLATPGATDTFAIVRASELPEMGKVIDQLNATPVQYPVEQAAIWIVTDDASYDELGMLVGGSPFGQPLIQEEDAARAMLLVDQAGVDIRKYSIWNDRYLLLPKVTEPDLVTWLSEAMGKAVTATPAGKLEATAWPTVALSGVEISQFAAEATASSELTKSDGSAMRATGAPDADGCGHQPNAAWASERPGTGATLTVLFRRPVIPKRIVVYETFRPGSIYYIEVLTTAGPLAIYEGSAGSVTQCPRTMTVDITDVNEPVSLVRLILAQEAGAWDQIDAVELIGVTP